MRQCLTSAHGGYYTTSLQKHAGQDIDQFGSKGDFITAPEISQAFGELLGIWFVAEWMSQWQELGQNANLEIQRDPKAGVVTDITLQPKIHLIELGPGRGTLMDDILRTIARFKQMAMEVRAVYFVEASPALREKQHFLLCGKESNLEQTTNGWESVSNKHFEVPIIWVEDMSLLPKVELGSPTVPFIIAHEFFDALPIHAFQSVALAPAPLESSPRKLLDAESQLITHPSSESKNPQWRELLVAPTKRPVFQTETTSKSQQEAQPEFHLTLAKASTPASLVLPESSVRYKRLKSHPGSTIEVSPEGYRYVQELAKLIGGDNIPLKTATLPSPSKPRPSGAALIIDYGPSSNVPGNSLRGIKSHRRVSPFTSPGEIDISADVDFTALAKAAIDASKGIEVYGPIEQGVFLKQMGIQQRAEALMAHAKDDEGKRLVDSAWRRLVDGGPGGMGKLYKVMAIVPESGGRRRPVAF